MSERVSDIDLEPAGPVGYSRVTLIGAHKRADLVLPSAEPVGALLPEILAILDEVAGGGPRRLGVATTMGNLLSPDATLAGSGVVDGAVLRLVTEDEIPPPPVVNDVTEETAGDLEQRRGRWTRSARTTSSVVAAAVVAALAVYEVVVADSAHDAFLVLLAGAAAGWLLAVVARLARQRSIAVAFAVCGSVAAGGLAVVGQSAQHWSGPDRIGLAVVAAAVGVGLTGVLTGRRGATLGAAVGLVLAGAWVALRRSSLHPAEADTLVAVAAVVVLGLLPRLALNFSGLASLDDRRLAGAQVSRRALESSLVVAHNFLVWATIGASIGFAIPGAALAERAQPWPLGVAGAGVVIVLLRARGLPLTVEKLATVAAAAAVAVTLAVDWLDGGRRLALPLICTLAVGVLVIASMPIDPPAHVQARLRGIADRVEAAAVLSLVPLVLGVFGVFGRLLHTF